MTAYYYVYAASSGEPLTGQSPDFKSLHTGFNGVDKTTAANNNVTISEVKPAGGSGGGWYRIPLARGDSPWDVTTEDLVGVVDIDPDDSESLAAGDRYIPVAFTLDGYLDMETENNAYQVTITMNDTDGSPIEGSFVWISASQGGTPAYRPSQSTDASGQAVFWLPNGVWYIFGNGAGYTYSNDESVAVSGSDTSKSVDYGTLVSASGTGDLSGANTLGFLYRALDRVRQETDEPSINEKYDNDEILRRTQEAYSAILLEVQKWGNTNVKATTTFDFEKDTTTYVLSPNVGRVLWVGERGESYGEKVFYSRFSEENSLGEGVSVEGNVVKFQNGSYLGNGTTVTVEYTPKGIAKMFQGTSTVFTATTVTLAATALGSRDVREKVYVGCYLHTLPNASNNYEEDRIITGFDLATETFTVSPAFTNTYSGTLAFEVYPSFGEYLDHVVATKVALDIMAIEGTDTRYRRLVAKYKDQIRTLGLQRANVDGRIAGKQFKDGHQTKRGRLSRGRITF